MIGNAHIKDLSLEQDSILNWQQFVDLISMSLNIPVSLIIRAVPPYGEIIKSSNSADNPYMNGEKAFLKETYSGDVIESKKFLNIPDMSKEKKFGKKNEHKKGMASYIGYPIMWPDGTVFGTISIMDVRVNSFGKNEKDLLKHFKKIIESQLKFINKYLELLNYTKNLETALFKGKSGSGDIIISCSYCKKIRFDDNSWRKIEEFLNLMLNLRISHGICPECTEELFQNYA